jgi:hypothetical protein
VKPIARFRRWVRTFLIDIIDRYHRAKDRRAIGSLERKHGIDIRWYDGVIPGLHNPDGRLSLLRERLDGRNARQAAGFLPVPPPDPTAPAPGAPDRRPVFRKDGQVHSFEAASWGKPFTRAQYDARHERYRPVPLRGAHTIDESED